MRELDERSQILVERPTEYSAIKRPTRKTKVFDRHVKMDPIFD